MKKIVFCIILFVTALSGAFSQKTIQLNYALGGFNEISVSNSFSVYVEKGDVQSVVVIVDENIADAVKVTVSGGTLSLSLDKGTLKKQTLKAHIVTPELKGVKLTGNSDLISNDTFVTDKFVASTAGSSDLKINIRASDVDINAIGSSDVIMNIEAMNLKLDLTGSSDAILTGKAITMIASCLGSSDIEASELLVTNAKISVAGSSDMTAKIQDGKAEVNVAGSSDLTLVAHVPELKVSSIGASEVKLSGKVTSFVGSCSGSSTINAFELIADDVTLDVIGASTVKTNANKTLNVKALNSSTVIYKGTPSVTSNVLGASSVRKQ